MALEDIFIIVTEEMAEGQYQAQLMINPDAELFEIHFPDLSIVPGACLIGFVAERLSEWKQDSSIVISKIVRATFGFAVTPDMWLSLEVTTRRSEQAQATSTTIVTYKFSPEIGRYSQGILEFKKERSCL